MVKHPRIFGPLVGLVLGLLIFSPTSAATITSDAFVAASGPRIEFLSRAGRLALTQTDNARVRAFGRGEIESQAFALQALADWRRADDAATLRDQTAPSLDHLGPVAGVLGLPYDVLASATGLASPPLTRLPSAESLDAASRQVLDTLASLHDANFVAVYATTQIETLQRLEAVYKSFILNGDDPILRRLAVKALPRVEHLLAQARRL